MPTKNESFSWQERGYTRSKVVSTVTGQVIQDTVSPVSVLRAYSSQSVTESNRNWRKRIKREPVLTGELHASITQQRAPSPMIGFRGVRDDQSKVIRTVENNPFVAIAPGLANLDTSLRTVATNKAIAILLKRYHRQTRALQGLVFLGELRETMELLRRPTHGVMHLLQRYLNRQRQTLTQYKRGRLSFKKATKKVSDEWLTFSFGVSPLISDYNDAANYYNKYWNEPKVGSVPISARAGAESSIPPIVVEQSFPDSWYLRHTNLVGQQVTIKLRSAFTAHAGSGPSAAVLGTSYRDFIPALWELIPWSFFVDYFTNVSDILEAWSYASVFAEGVQQTTIWERRSSSEGWTFDNRSTSPFISPIGGTMSGSVIQKAKNIDRVKLSALPIPTFQVSTGLDLSYKRWANILALSRSNMPVFQRR